MPGLPIQGAPDEIERLEEVLADVWGRLEKAKQDIQRRKDLSGTLFKVATALKFLLEAAEAIEKYGERGNASPEQWERFKTNYKQACFEMARLFNVEIPAPDPEP